MQKRTKVKKRKVFIPEQNIDVTHQPEKKRPPSLETLEDGLAVSQLYHTIIGSGLDSSNSNKTKPESQDQTKNHCSICQDFYTESLEDHISSLVHTFKRFVENGPPPKVYHISESNPGYQILKNKLGWDESHGLGKDKQGPLNPVATRLKRDRLGIGHELSEKNKLRVTHFASEYDYRTLLPEDMARLDYDSDQDHQIKLARARDPIFRRKPIHPQSIALRKIMKSEMRIIRRKRKREKERLNKEKDANIHELIYRDPLHSLYRQNGIKS
eukprot:TRINITY_DN3579_c0_g1_i1.p1 TRINITY_DN3579_c0_g1~~TRINITY_DN3579_c0_g1_i1.p1  ORF type:complete len:279 (+),score=61.07 TRINITY_DN3579_c0_g1_i1:30-839(+)